jgi:hypothetical protein
MPPTSLPMSYSSSVEMPRTSGLTPAMMSCPTMKILLKLASDNFRMNTSYGRYGATYNMVALICVNDKLPCV